MIRFALALMAATACLIASTGTAEGATAHPVRRVGAVMTPGARDGTAPGAPRLSGHRAPGRHRAHVNHRAARHRRPPGHRVAHPRVHGRHRAVGRRPHHAVSHRAHVNRPAPRRRTRAARTWVGRPPNDPWYSDQAYQGGALAGGRARTVGQAPADGRTATGAVGSPDQADGPADDPTDHAGDDPLRGYGWPSSGTTAQSPETPADGTANAGTTAPAAPRDVAHPAGSGTNVTADPRSLGAQLFHGMGFDACTAPDLQTMAAWRDSPYGAVGVYIGGRARSCTQSRLNRSWVRAVDGMGWRIVPIFVGSQSPCADGEHQREFPINAAHPDRQGASEGADAVRAAASLGMLRDSPVYLDMESYDISTARCTRPVIAFTQAWSKALRARGYLPGFYSSADAGITQIEAERAAGAPNLPDVMWFARWNGDATYDEPVLPAGQWSPHRRIHQYVGDTRESYDGYELSIDRDLIDAPVAIVA